MDISDREAIFKLLDVKPKVYVKITNKAKATGVKRLDLVKKLMKKGRI